MSTALFWVVFAGAVVTVFGIGWAREYEKRLEAEHEIKALDALLAASERERLELDAFYRRHRQAYEDGIRGGAQSVDRAEFGRLRVIPGDPDSQPLRRRF